LRAKNLKAGTRCRYIIVPFWKQLSDFDPIVKSCFKGASQVLF
jgi:hypothetical protein